jgi:hypothetical protein
MRKVARRLLIAAVALVMLLLAALGCVYQASRSVPAFYRQALAAPTATQHQSGQRFEQHAMALHNQLYHAGRWEIHFTEDEINGWLAADLPEKFPQALPAGVSGPRISIDGGVVHLAVRYQRGAIDTIVSLAGDACLTDQPNEIAVRIDQARAGLVPVPLARFLHEISERAARANVPLRWTEDKGVPVALVRVPLDADNARRRLTLERVQFAGGELIVAGRTEDDSLDSSQPVAPNTAAQPAASETRQR